MASEQLPDAFLPTEVATLARVYDIALSYFGAAYLLAAADRRCLARLTVMAGGVRRQRDNNLASIVDAHAIVAVQEAKTIADPEEGLDMIRRAATRRRSDGG